MDIWLNLSLSLSLSQQIKAVFGLEGEAGGSPFNFSPEVCILCFVHSGQTMCVNMARPVVT